MAQNNDSKKAGRGATRREVLHTGALLATAAGVLAPGSAAAAAAPQRGGRKSIYDSVGVHTLINARGTVTIVGATRTLPEVKRAMEEAARDYVQIDELMDGVGKRLGQLTGTEFGVVTSGASAALTIATAACVTGGDPDRMMRIPNLAGMKDEVIIPAYSRSAYDAGVKAIGVRMIQVGSPQELEAAFGPRTAMVMVLAGSASMDGPMSLKVIGALAKPRGVPVLVDAAAEELYVPNPHYADGADLIAYSGGKCLRGPQCAGLLIGRENLVRASWINNAPHHGVGRGLKVGREEIMGMLAAVDAWRNTRNHVEEQKMWTSWAQTIVRRLEGIPGVSCEIGQPRGLGNRSPSVRVRWDMAKIPLTGQDMEQILWDGEPRIAVSGMGSFLPFPPNMEPNISITMYQLEAGEEKIIADRVHAVLSNPPVRPKRSGAPAFDVTGQWDLEIKFAATTTQQTLAFEQKGNNLIGTHYGSYAARDLGGTLHGKDILFRSSYTLDGVRLNFEFTGTVAADSMQGQVSLGEYGMAAWSAKRRTYRVPGARGGRA